MNGSTSPAAAIPPAERRPRVWPGVIIVALVWAALKLPNLLELEPQIAMKIVFNGVFFLPIAFLVWWLLFSRVSWTERLFGLVACAGVGFAAFTQFHYSFRGKDPSDLMMSLMFNILPVVMTTWVVWLVVARWASRPVRIAGLLAVFVATWAFFVTVRFEGTTGAFQPQFSFRWTPTDEEKAIAQHAAVVQPANAAAEVTAARLEAQPGDWPGFRGPNRDGVVRGVDIDTTSSPTEVWRRRVGPGWSSVIVVGDSLFTQEQRGAHEAVVCYATLTGDETWCHADDIRFSEETAGTGPRATPCFDKGKIFAVGCTGVLNCLDADTGERVWTHDLAAEFGAELPHWGFTSSPLVVGDLVVVFAGGRSTRNLLAYRTGTGELAWAAAAGETSYASPQVAKIDDQAEVLMMTNHGLTGVEPTTGKVLWDVDLHVPPSAPRSISPLPVSTTAILVGSEGDFGVKLIDVKRVGKTSEASARWTSKALKPAFNDPVVADGNIYGFDGRIFACVDLETGTRRWKEGRYGEGQVVLLADQSVLLVVSESGEVILLSANPGRHEKLGHFQALHGKSWSHPALVGRKLYLRNAEEMVCYEFRSPVPVK